MQRRSLMLGATAAALSRPETAGKGPCVVGWNVSKV
jgi:hypothetical protein